MPLAMALPQKGKERKKSYTHGTAEVNLAEHGLGSFEPLVVSSQIVIYLSDWKGRERYLFFSSASLLCSHSTALSRGGITKKKTRTHLHRKIDRTGLSRCIWTYSGSTSSGAHTPVPRLFFLALFGSFWLFLSLSFLFTIR